MCSMKHYFNSVESEQTNINHARIAKLLIPFLKVRVILGLLLSMVSLLFTYFVLNYLPPNLSVLSINPPSNSGIYWAPGQKYFTQSDNTTIHTFNELIDQNPQNVWSYQKKWFPTNTPSTTSPSTSTRIIAYYTYFPNSSLATLGQSDVATYMSTLKLTYNVGNAGIINISAIHNGYGLQFPPDPGSVSPTYWYSFQYQNIVFQIWSVEGPAGSITIPRSLFTTFTLSEYNFVNAHIGSVDSNILRSIIFVAFVVDGILVFTLLFASIWWHKRTFQEDGIGQAFLPKLTKRNSLGILNNSRYASHVYNPQAIVNLETQINSGNFQALRNNDAQTTKQPRLDPPPTPEEMKEALLNPWPGHTPSETIERNRRNNIS